MATIPFTYKNCPVTPGAYMINSGGGSFPIFCSIPNYQTLGMTNGSSGCDNYYIIMPGYAIYVFTIANYGNGSLTFYKYNSNNYPIIVATSNVDRGLCCYLYLDDGINLISSDKITAG